MMIAPDSFVNSYRNVSYLKLIKVRDRLICQLQEFEKKEFAGDRSDPAWGSSPNPEVQYQVTLKYLAGICKLMKERYNSEYVWGDRTLKQDAEQAVK